MQLAIDTSTETASIAIVQDSRVLAELSWQCQLSHTTELLPHLFQLLTQVEARLEMVSAIIVAKGPGSFNGLRAGISTTKGLAFSLGCPIIGISTLEAAAYPHAETGLPVCPVFNAGRGEIATALYQQRQQWCQLVAEHITTTEALGALINSQTIFCGEITPDTARQIRSRLKSKAILISPAPTLCRAVSLAELGLKRLKAGQYDDLTTLQPLYLRRPPITQPKKRQRIISEPETN
ncbi:MAG: tRNA (adenosine(37)-N6)-threonylcarbamoyltransferase complex dimerization subunit type 1 TsaB [Dehalococcoidia bacterium]|nr:MAG: tRNA (adenosine(37)-N6)-threonylcarbamoyltransferase complex dimerization subunit type 1 TsaB [Dehalococcoidia bacterium]